MGVVLEILLTVFRIHGTAVSIPHGWVPAYLIRRHVHKDLTTLQHLFIPRPEVSSFQVQMYTLKIKKWKELKLS